MQFERITPKDISVKPMRIGCVNTIMIDILNTLRDKNKLTYENIKHLRKNNSKEPIHNFYSGAVLFVGRKHHEFFLNYFGEFRILTSARSELLMMERLMLAQHCFSNMQDDNEYLIRNINNDNIKHVSIADVKDLSQTELIIKIQ